MFLAILTFTKLTNPKPGVMDEIARLSPGEDLGMALLLVLYYSLFESRYLRWVLMLFCLPCLVVAQLVSIHRASAVGTLIAIVTTSFILGDKRHSLRRTLTGLVVLALIFVSGTIAFKWVRRVPQAAEAYSIKWEEMGELMRGRRTTGSAGKRLPFYEAALRTISERPALGLGVGGWNVYYRGTDAVYLKGQRIVDYPHNVILEVAAEEGLVGLLAFVIFLGTVASVVMKTVRQDRSFQVLLPLFIFVLTCSMFVGDIENNRLPWLWCGMPLAVSRMVTRGLTERQPG